jgi:hypothetical protein
MYREDGQVVELERVQAAIEQADVLIVGFPGFLQRLLVDARTTAGVGPLVEVVEPLGGVEERMFWLGQNRPQFGMPQRFTFFVWPHSIAFLEESGVAEALRSAVPDEEGRVQLEAAQIQLRALERAAARAAVDGEPWRTLWHAQGTSRSR